MIVVSSNITRSSLSCLFMDSPFLSLLSSAQEREVLDHNSVGPFVDSVEVAVGEDCEDDEVVEAHLLVVGLGGVVSLHCGADN